MVTIVLFISYNLAFSIEENYKQDIDLSLYHIDIIDIIE
jgi:hypothetical protein